MYEADYITLVESVIAIGEHREGRNGGTTAVFGTTLNFDLADGFPLLSGRKLYYKGVLGELAAMLRGPKSVEDFERFGCNYWKSWGDDNGILNVDYGNAWLHFNGVNQLDRLVRGLKSSPADRRHIITGWNPGNLDDLSLPCCHLLYQWYVREGKYLDMLWYQRSADIMIGVPSDAILAATWNIILANEVGYAPGHISMIFGDSHIYDCHLPEVTTYLLQAEQLSDEPIHYSLDMAPGQPHTEFEPNMLSILNYKPNDPIKFELVP